jgi:hypothetical protein
MAVDTMYQELHHQVWLLKLLLILEHGNSIVKYEGWDQIIDGTDSPSAAQLTTWTTGANPVDIIVIGYAWGMNAAEAQVLKNYLAKGGVIVAYSESNGGMQNLFRNVFDGSVNTGSVNSAGAIINYP